MNVKIETHDSVNIRELSLAANVLPALDVRPVRIGDIHFPNTDHLDLQQKAIIEICKLYYLYRIRVAE